MEPAQQKAKRSAEQATSNKIKMDTFEVGTDEKKETRNPNNCYY